MPTDSPGLPERTQRLGERLIRQHRADQVDRAPEENLEPGAAGTSRELGGDPGLADARLSRDQDGRALPGPRGAERALELRELACAPDEHLARASLHPGQYRAANPRREGRS